ncbi:MAG: hypothetical protein L3K11_08110 [Thermoplasmata archaeon]|nr:hypothetical protein [Thermoplasmata archaeon]
MIEVEPVEHELSLVRPGSSAILLPRPLLRPASELPRGSPGHLFPLAPHLYGWLERRFAPGAATLLSGPSESVHGFLTFLLAAVAAAERQVSLRDGANRFSPYAIAALGRRWEVPVDELLDRIRLARAFTAHQMVTLAESWRDDEVGEAAPADLLVAGDPALLFAEEDVEPYERAALLPHVARCLRDLLRSTERPLLIVRYSSAGDFPWEEAGVPAHEILRLRPSETGGVLLSALRARERLELLALAPHQHHLEEYETDPAAAGGGVEPWDGPSLPTAMP